MNFLEIVNEHGWDIQDIVMQRHRASVYREFDAGFVMLVPHEDIDILIAASYNDEHSMDMWRVIRSLLKSRTRPIITQYERNFDKLFKASQRYGGIARQNGIVIFPMEGT